MPGSFRQNKGNGRQEKTSSVRLKKNPTCSNQKIYGWYRYKPVHSRYYNLIKCHEEINAYFRSKGEYYHLNTL